MSENTIFNIYIALLLISCSHVFFGRKNIPIWAWRISLLFSIVSGMFLGFALLPFPQSLYAGCMFAAGTVFINRVTRGHLMSTKTKELCENNVLHSNGEEETT
ncbi:MAG: hypothetical protein GY755_17770 [Chloroflexi bacterium]|nr:hypothetical protein [Chloroflexota bacterium]